MNKIDPVNARPVDSTAAHAHTRGAKPPGDAKVHKAAQEFEAMFVRQILTAAKVGGHDKASGYDGMAVDAIASAVTQGGGLGLARQIEDALSHSGATAPQNSKR